MWEQAFSHTISENEISTDLERVVLNMNKIWNILQFYLKDFILQVYLQKCNVTCQK